MAEKLRKLLLYFQPLESYWKATNESDTLAVPPGRIGRYPLDFVPRLEQGHYGQLDDEGLPVRLVDDGSGPYHNYTTLSSFALANWDQYLRTGRQAHAAAVRRVADFMLRNAERLPDGSVLLREKNKPHPSAMNQGEGISVLLRAWLLSDQRRYRELARGCLLPFTRRLDQQGVTAQISANGALWYEETAGEPLRHILNGMIYSLWGLRDFVSACGDPLAEELFAQGVDSVERSLPLFDAGYWSRYWVPEDGRNYLSSIMYHNLHVVQLGLLARQTGRAAIQAYADRFQRYSASALNRLRAGLSLTMNKISLRRATHAFCV